MKLEITIIDAFTDTVFKGNSAGVIVLEDWLEEELMQSIAMQNNLSETAYLVKQDTDSKNETDPTYHIRWFSPVKEMDFCGHATLASAFHFFQQNPILTSVNFYAEAVGTLKIQKNENAMIRMNFPNNKPKLIYSKKTGFVEALQNPQSEIESLLNGLAIKPIEVYKNHQAYFVVYENAEQILTFSPDNQLMQKLAPLGLAVTAKANLDKYNNHDFVSRYFSQAIGGNEDPVTGSIHTALAPLWSEKLGKDTLLAYQASSRGGELECEVIGDRVYISGYAVRYLQGFIEV